MLYRKVTSLVLALLIGLVLGATARADPIRTQTQQQVVIVGGMNDDRFITLTANLAASGRSAVVLLDRPSSIPHAKTFLAACKPAAVIPVGSFPDGIADLEQRLGIKAAPFVEWKRGPPAALWKELFPQAERVVVCQAQPRGLLLQGACLAGVLQAPLFVVQGEQDEAAELRSWLGSWKTREVTALGDAAKLCRDLKDVQLVELADEQAVAAAYVKHQLAKGPINTLVVTNPGDDQEGLGRMSLLAPWVALQKRAALLLTSKAGNNSEEVVQAALKTSGLRSAESLILMANLKAIPMLERPNPVAGKDKVIQMEPLTPTGSQPFTFATGRLFHEDLSVVALMLARQRLLQPVETVPGSHPPRPRKALVISNPGGGLPLLEIISRNTAREFRNAGYQTTALFHEKVTKEQVRQLLPEHDIFLWEGHHKTLVKDYQFPSWTEPLPSSLVFLQTCLVLNEEEAHPLLRRGAVAIVGSPTRNYSGSGGAFSLAFFDALLYEDQSLGCSLRQAKNFLLCYSLLKEKRLGDGAKLGGANLRSAWAFTLWGDPNLKLPRPPPPQDALPHVRHRVQGKTIILTVPEKMYDKIVTEKYQSELWPNARLAGLLNSGNDQDERNLVPFLYTEVSLPGAPPGKTPRLSSRVPSSRWVLCWDARRSVGYLLVAPRLKDEKELRFQVHWDE